MTSSKRAAIGGSLPRTHRWGAAPSHASTTTRYHSRPLLRGDLPNEEYLRDPSEGEVVRRAWSPNRVDLHASLTRPARVYINQNWHPGWRASVGEVRQESGLLVLDLPAGEHDVALRFLPRAGLGGIAVTLAALIATAFIAWRARDKDSIEGGRAWSWLAVTACAPLLLGVGIVCLVEGTPNPATPARCTERREHSHPDATRGRPAPRHTLRGGSHA